MNKPGRDRLLRIPGWTVATYEFADRAYVSTYRNDERYDLTFRKGRVIVGMGSKSQTDIVRFSKYILAAMSKVE